MNTNKLRRDPTAAHIAASVVFTSKLWDVRSYGGGLAITVHNRQEGTSLGIEGADAYAVLAYAEAMEENYPLMSSDLIWLGVWRDFDMSIHAKPDRTTAIQYVA